MVVQPMSVNLDDVEKVVTRWKAAIGPGGPKAWEGAQLARQVEPLVAELRALRAKVDDKDAEIRRLTRESESARRDFDGTHDLYVGLGIAVQTALRELESGDAYGAGVTLRDEYAKGDVVQEHHPLKALGETSE